MSDDLFWPPLGGGDDDDRSRERVTRPIATNAGTSPSAEPSDAPAAEPSAAHSVGHSAATDASETEHGGAGEASPWWVGTPAQSTQPMPVQRRPRRRLGVVPVAAVTAFVFGAGGVAVGAAVVGGDDSNPVSSNNAGLTVSNIAKSQSVDPKSYSGIAARVLPSVVSITVTGTDSADTGSGVVLRKDGYILTNNHVVSAATSGGSVSATFNDGSSASAKIIGTDSLDDLAVIKVSRTDLTPATLGSSSAVHVGDAVLAVGSPLGLSGTVTSGIVSALNRPVVTQDESQQQDTNPFGFGNGQSNQSTQQTVIDAIQTDAAINPGNSGGPLVNGSGQVVGINSAIASLGSSLGSSQSGSIGVGFAIPIDQARSIAAELISTGKATHPLLGVSLTDTTKSNGAKQALVHAVTSGGPADKAGIKAGDIITAVGGERTSGADAVIAAIRSHQPNEKVSVDYTRSGSSKTVEVTLTDASTQDS